MGAGLGLVILESGPQLFLRNARPYCGRGEGQALSALADREIQGDSEL